MSLENYLQELASPDAPVKHTGLLQLSALSKEEMVVFEEAWRSFSPDRKLQVLPKLIELSEDTAELDFIPVFHLCLNDSNDEIREKAVSGLWECDDRSLITPLISLLSSDPSENVRVAAAIALGKFCYLAVERKLLERDCGRLREALHCILTNPEEPLEVRRRSLEAIATFNTAEIQAFIREAYKSDEPGLKHSAVYAMGRSIDTVWLPTVIKELESSEEAMRFEAVNACGAMGEEETVPDLIPLLEDDDLQVQLAVVQALGAIGGSLAKRALLKCAKSGDDALEESARLAIELESFDGNSSSFPGDG